MNRGEAKRLEDEINQTPGWKVLELYELYLNTDNPEYGLRVVHWPSETLENILNQTAWEALKAQK